MKTLLRGMFAGMMLCAVSVAQGSAPAAQGGQSAGEQPTETSSGQASGAARVAAGSVIPVQLARSIDAKKAKTGDEVEAKTTQDLKAVNGTIIMPKDTKVVGHVTAAQARNKEQKESQIGLAFDHAVIKNGGDVPLPMSIQAIIAAPSSNPGNDNYGGGGGYGQAASGPGATPGYGGGRSTGMGTGTPPQAPGSSTTGSGEPTSGQTSTNTHQPITGNTQGVVGISNLKLSAAPNMTQGSVISSEKGNVKLESGTLMLLRVNQ